MKILVTGGCGFLGSHICEFYKKLGWDVVAYDNLTKHELTRTGYDIEATRYYNFNLLKNMGVEIIQNDVRNLSDLESAAKDCDFIAHTAAQPAMTISIENPELDISTNVIGTFNVLETARKYDIPVVNCSTVHVHGNDINENLTEADTRFIRDPPTISEKDPIMQGHLTPLHASKRSGEIYVQTYIDTYGLKAATFRLSGMYGPNQFGGEDHGWVANFVIRTLLKMPIKIYGTDKQVRDILYATDAVRAFDAFFNRQKSGLYDVGGGKKNIISLGETLNLIKEISGVDQIINYEPKRAGDLWYFACDISKIRKQLQWEPIVSNRKGIEEIVNWVKNNINLFGVKK